MALLPPIVLELRARATELYSELGKVKGEVSTMSKDTEKSTSKMSTAFHGVAAAGKAITIAGVGAAIAIGGFSLEVASAAQVVDAKLNTALKNTGSSMQKMAPQIEALDAKQRKYGNTNEETNAALAEMTTALGSPKKAMDQLGIASDLARQKGISLSAAGLLVAKTSEGQSRGLRALGIDIPVAATNTMKLHAANVKLGAANDAVTAIMAKHVVGVKAVTAQHLALEKAQKAVVAAQANVTTQSSAGGLMLETLKNRVKGAADAYGGTLRGQLAAAKAGVADIGEKLGKVLIPIVEAVIKTGTQWTNWLMKHRPVLIAMAVIVGGILLVAVGAYVVSMIAAAAATIAAMWPLILIIAVIALVVAAVLWLVANWGSVVSFIKTTWAAIVGFFAAIGATIIGWWNGFWNGIGNFAKQVFQNDMRFIGAIFQGIHDFFSAIGGAISTVWNNIWSGLGDIVRGAFNGVVSFVHGILNSIIGIINAVIDGINTVTSTGAVIGVHVGAIPHMPRFAIGSDRVPGLDGQPLGAVVHGGEAILSNDMLNGRAPIGPRAMAAAAAQSANGFGGTNRANEQRVVNMTNNFNTNADSDRITHDIGWLLQRQG